MRNLSTGDSKADRRLRSSQFRVSTSGGPASRIHRLDMILFREDVSSGHGCGTIGSAHSVFRTEIDELLDICSDSLFNVTEDVFTSSPMSKVIACEDDQTRALPARESGARTDDSDCAWRGCCAGDPVWVFVDGRLMYV